MIKKIFQIVILSVISCYCVYSSFHGFTLSFSIKSYDEGNLRFEGRLNKLRELIPLKRGVIGYFSKEKAGTTNHDSGNTAGEYVLSQYALSPLILDTQNYHEWNILNMPTDAFKIWNGKRGVKFKVIASGGGFYLVQRLSK